MDRRADCEQPPGAHHLRLAISLARLFARAGHSSGLVTGEITDVEIDDSDNALRSMSCRLRRPNRFQQGGNVKSFGIL
jgi:hypothetical protein